MIVQCPKCTRFFDDQFRWTICPHETFAANDGENNFEHHLDSYLADLPPVDRSKRCMTSGKPEAPDHREIDPKTGMQKDYVVLCPEERKKGFVRPVRRTYLHLTCGTTTTMGLALAETYARDPKFYSGTFCCACRAHFPLDQFVWDGTEEKLGT